MPRIASLYGHEILDSRGNPTLRVHLALDDGTRVSSSVPSGASTGANEAVELRDRDRRRYAGKGVRKAVAGVNKVIAKKLAGLDPSRQAEIDALLCALDGTPNKAKLGANAILGVSMDEDGAKAVRRFVKKLIETDLPDCRVVSYAELLPEVAIQPLGKATLAGI